MQTLEDIVIDLQPPVNPGLQNRKIEVDLAGRVNFNVYGLRNQFQFTQGGFNEVLPDLSSRTGVIISMPKDISVANVTDNLAVTYFADAANADSLTGRIVFKGQEFSIGAAPISFELDSCTIPDKITIDISKYNNGLPVRAVSVGANNPAAGSIEINSTTTSDYNDDYSDDFGTEPNSQIVYTLDAGFWKALEARDQFEYIISYRGRTAKNLITIQKIK